MNDNWRTYLNEFLDNLKIWATETGNTEGIFDDKKMTEFKEWCSRRKKLDSTW